MKTAFVLVTANKWHFQMSFWELQCQKHLIRLCPRARISAEGLMFQTHKAKLWRKFPCLAHEHGKLRKATKSSTWVSFYSVLSPMLATFRSVFSLFLERPNPRLNHCIESNSVTFERKRLVILAWGASIFWAKYFITHTELHRRFSHRQRTGIPRTVILSGHNQEDPRTIPISQPLGTFHRVASKIRR